ncbi:acetylornithine aminotransferase [Sulfuriferula plumbiphila]|uniref:Acetylornithine aminotransferase n=1 Tax=Sulfuriferula plumbiphila TaxID=171865 RepID=A0A512LBU8_9PROT|nr:aspartate aminotransferase family protein [Sulfuriferula plumbiphila]BBP04125.1 acetylornithine aminotransferase [Sulfuriferula plumbiphila]GEP31960.1 acetylornithine aminotransferase [Sulfuriferula plumbiphila]
MSYLMNTYARQPVTFVRGEGVWLWDEAGNKYLDALAGVAVNGLGHAHPKLSAALCEQARTLIHTSNIYEIRRQEQLAERLCRISGMDKAFFCNSGCEANEAAIKLARLYGHHQGITRPTIIVMEKAFHGRTMATLTATGSRKVQAGFEPLLTGFARVPYNDVEAVRQVAEHNHDVVAILVEPIQGEGGIKIPDAGYLLALRKICDDKGWLLMLDEVQSGIGRTGTWFGFQHTGILPDVMALAKGLGSGMPIGACLARGAAAEVFRPGNHGSTFGGNPLACTAGLITLQTLEDEGLLANATRIGGEIVSGLKRELEGVAGIRQIRGLGMMIGIELDRPCGELVRLALAQHLLINVTADNVVRLVPPLVMNPAEAALLVAGLAPLIRDFLGRAA